MCFSKKNDNVFELINTTCTDYCAVGSGSRDLDRDIASRDLDRDIARARDLGRA